MGFSGFVLERSTERAWWQLETRLLEVLRQMDGDDVLVAARRSFDGTNHPGEPYVQFCVWGDRQIRAEASSNRHLRSGSRLDPVQSSQLISLGFRPPSSHDADTHPDQSTNFFVDAPSLRAPQLAKLAVRALRDVFGVVHPAFLRFSGRLTNAAEASGTALAFQPGRAVGREETSPDGPLSFAESWSEDTGGPIAMPRSSDHLRSLVNEALAPLLGNPPRADDEGNVQLRYHGTVLSVGVVDDARVVSVSAQIAAGLDDLEAAAARVWLLNREVEAVKFYLRGDRILAGCTLPASPFVGGQLRILVSLVSQVAREFEEVNAGFEQSESNAASPL